MTTHPAKFSGTILTALDAILPKSGVRMLDPFAGTGKIRLVRPDVICGELEWEWARWAQAQSSAPTIQHNARHLPFAKASFDVVVTSCTYGNRMADLYDGHDGSRRNTYRIALGCELHPDNSGGMQWGDAYREFHKTAWAEVYRVLKPRGCST